MKGNVLWRLESPINTVLLTGAIGCAMSGGIRLVGLVLTLGGCRTGGGCDDR